MIGTKGKKAKEETAGGAKAGRGQVSVANPTHYWQKAAVNLTRSVTRVIFGLEVCE
jgi:hypothetical protein